MKTPFYFRFDDELKKQVEEFAGNQNPKESIAMIIHRALIKYINS